ncbi:hypothetical protein [Pradoshia eiseniae]|nr:hypothetical protein [Pradoshia eiseniae]
MHKTFLDEQLILTMADIDKIYVCPNQKLMEQKDLPLIRFGQSNEC